MADVRFAPLRVHSWYSLLEGVDSPRTLLERADACGYEALALTDANSLTGAVEFVQAARDFRVRPILGCHLRHRQGQQATALVADSAGWR
jgi:DNA polymerase III alpha subunit